MGMKLVSGLELDTDNLTRAVIARNKIDNLQKEEGSDATVERVKELIDCFIRE